MNTPDIIVVGTGAAGLFCTLQLPRDKKILLITKDKLENSDSYLAQGGICVLKDAADYDSFLEDTLKAGHYENNRSAVKTMIEHSQSIIAALIEYGVDFAQEEGHFLFTKEGGHTTNRILYHADATGQEITSKLFAQVQQLPQVTLREQWTMVDLLEVHGSCHGIIVRDETGRVFSIPAAYTILACGGVGGLYEHSTNFPHLTGDGVAIAIAHQIALQNIDYVQIHPTTLYSTKSGRRFLISESVRGEGALLYDAHCQRFTDELQPRDLLTAAIWKQMAKDGANHVWLDLRPIGAEKIVHRFPNIYRRCLEEGYDPARECIPVVPAQHYFMGGIQVDEHSRTSMERLYAIGETSCNGVHGANRLASNSLLESLVFAECAAIHLAEHYTPLPDTAPVPVNTQKYEDSVYLQQRYRQMVLKEMERSKLAHV